MRHPNLRLLQLFCLIGSTITAAAQARADDLNLHLGAQMKDSVSLSGEVPADAKHAIHRSLEVTSDKKRTIALFSINAYMLEGKYASKRIRKDLQIGPDSPLKYTLRAKPGAKWHVVAVDQKETVISTRDVYGAPAPDAPLADRFLKDHTFFFYYKNPMANKTPISAATFSAKLFIEIDPAFIVYVTQKPRCSLGARTPAVGEPVLLESASSRDIKLRRANGQRAQCYVRRKALGDFFSASRPAKLVMPPAAEYEVHEVKNLWHDEEFMQFADENPRIAKYKARKEKAEQCFDRTWKKLDPGGRANRYDVVTFDRQGRVKKVEGYAARLQRKVNRKCKLKALMRARTAIRKALKKEFKKKSAALLAEVAEHLAG